MRHDTAPKCPAAAPYTSQRINRSARPTALTAADRARMAAAVTRHDARAARERASARTCRIAVVALAVAMTAAFFYGAQPDTYRATVAHNGEAYTIDYNLSFSDCAARIENLARASCELER